MTTIYGKYFAPCRDDSHEVSKAVGAAEERERIRALVANDAQACTFQSLGQYRSWLLKFLTASPNPKY